MLLLRQPIVQHKDLAQWSRSARVLFSIPNPGRSALVWALHPKPFVDVITLQSSDCHRVSSSCSGQPCVYRRCVAIAIMAFPCIAPSVGCATSSCLVLWFLLSSCSGDSPLVPRWMKVPTRKLHVQKSRHQLYSTRLAPPRSLPVFTRLTALAIVLRAP